MLLRENGVLSGDGDRAKGDAWVMPEGGSAMVYVTNPARRDELVPKLRTIFTGAEGVERVYSAEAFGKLGLPTQIQSDQAPDLMLVAKPDYMFGNVSEGAYITREPGGGTHGYLNTDPQMQAIFIAWGSGIPRGVQLGNIPNVDVAPTTAALLGIKMGAVKGHAIEQIVKRSARSSPARSKDQRPQRASIHVTNCTHRFLRLVSFACTRGIA